MGANRLTNHAYFSSSKLNNFNCCNTHKYRLFIKPGIQVRGRNAGHAGNAGNVHQDSEESFRGFRGMLLF